MLQMMIPMIPFKWENTIYKASKSSLSLQLIDNIFTNSLNKDNNSGVFTYDVTDHLPIFLISSHMKVNNVKNPSRNYIEKKIQILFRL